MQHPYNNAILKIDADPARRTFGTVIDAYSRTSEHYNLDRNLPSWQDNAICRTDPTLIPNQDRSQSTGRLELDLDFGSSPTMYTDGRGRRLVADTVFAPCDAAAITTLGSPGAIVAYRAT